MLPKNFVGGEGASAPGLNPAVQSIPCLVVWPVLLTGGTVKVETSQQVYYLAHELALALLRPRVYERAHRFVAN